MTTKHGKMLNITIITEIQYGTTNKHKNPNQTKQKLSTGRIDKSML